MTDAARPEVMDFFRTAVIEKSARGAMSQGAHAFSDVIRLGWYQYGLRLREPPRRSVWELVKEEIDGGNFAVPDDYEIGSGVSWWPARAARCPPNPTAIAYLLRRGERLILEVRMSSLDHACDTVDLVTAPVSTVRFVEHSVFVEDLIDRCASTHGVDLTEYLLEIAKR
jgi:hypothetical protein